jgi:crossover junction endodeoxyribonuclease RuvC
MTLFTVDPGLEGAFAVLDEDGALLATGEFPVVGTGANRRLALAGFADLVAQFRVDRALVEDGQPMPRQGVSSVYRYGRAAGAVEGALSALKIGTEFVRPSVWKRTFGSAAADKGNMRALAAQKWPSMQDRFVRVKDHHRAEAALMGAWFITRSGRNNPKGMKEDKPWRTTVSMP